MIDHGALGRLSMQQEWASDRLPRAESEKTANQCFLQYNLRKQEMGHSEMFEEVEAAKEAKKTRHPKSVQAVTPIICKMLLDLELFKRASMPAFKIKTFNKLKLLAKNYSMKMILSMII